MSTRPPYRVAGRLAKGKIGEPEHRVIIEEALARRHSSKDMVAKAPVLFIEGVLPEELTGAARRSDPLRLAKDFARVRQASNGQSILRHYDLVIAGRLWSLIANSEQLGPQRGELGQSVMKARSVFL